MESPCDIEILNNAFVDASTLINPMIAERTKKYMSLYWSMIERGTFAYGQGYIQTNQTFFGGIHVQDAGASWAKVETSRPPNPDPEANDPGVDACRYESKIINYGFLEKQFELFQTTRRTLDICLTDILFKWQFEKQLALILKMLKNVTVGEWEQYLREQYINFSQKLIASNSPVGLGLDTFALPLFSDTITIPAGGFDRIGRLTQEILDRVYEFVVRQAPDAMMGEQSGFPLYGLITSFETSKEIIRNDTDRREDFRHVDSKFLIEGFGSATAYQGFAHVHDPHAPRFRVDPTGTKLVRIFPYKEGDTTIGSDVNVDEDYITAPFELSVIFIKDVFKALIPPPNPASLAQGYTFNPQGNFGEFNWLNIQDLCTNPLREKGHFFARFRAAAEPLQYSNDAFTILHRRCQDVPISVCQTCDTEGTGAITVTTCTQADATVAEDDATQFLLLLADCPPCSPGQQVTVTFAGALTKAAIIQSDGNAPEIQVAFLTPESGGICNFDGGMVSLTCG